MPRTLGYHIVLSGYGLWLPGDDRGHWSTAWDENLGHIEPHTLHPGDPVRLRMSRERMTQPPVRLTPDMIATVIDVWTQCAAESDWHIVAASLEPTHAHLLLTYTPRNIDNTIKWLKSEATKAIHQRTTHAGKVWCKGRWRGFIFDPPTWTNTQRYIERHNLRRNLLASPYPFITTP
ncbi:MAG: transposase [Phycisphaeraceae bacterium]|nr:transposase [Phycisphaeraceae bacterium]